MAAIHPPAAKNSDNSAQQPFGGLRSPDGLCFCIHAVNKLEWSKPLEIIKYPDPRLRAPNAKIAVFDDSLLELAKEMIKVMYE
jgi:hypothetical protein